MDRYVRTSISVPLVLRRAMTAAQTDHEVNWSAVACEAFRKKLASLSVVNACKGCGAEVEFPPEDGAILCCLGEGRHQWRVLRGGMTKVT